MLNKKLTRAIAQALVVIAEQKVKPRNPVGVMNSVQALDLMHESLRHMRDNKPASPALLAAIRGQIQEHRHALRNIIGNESL